MGDIEKLKMCLDNLGDWNLKSLSQRKILQKKIYFLQQFNLDLGYSFGFYVYGPYSSPLTDDAYFLTRALEKAPETVQEMKPSRGEQESIKKTNEFFDEFRSSNTEEMAHQIEVLASLHFLWNFSYMDKKTKDKVFSKLVKMKKFENDELQIAWNLLSKYVLINC